MFNRAIEIDPGFARAWAGLADAESFTAQWMDRSAGHIDAADRASRKALELDPNLAEAHTSLAKLFEHREDTERAELEYRKAIELNPNYATVHHWYALMLAFQGRFSEALQEAEKAEALDPLSAIINNMVAIALDGEGRFEEALAGYRKAIENDRAMPVLYGNIGALYAYAYGRFDKAIPWDEKASEAGQKLDNKEWVRFDEIAGDLMNYKPNAWERLNSTALTYTKEEVTSLLGAAV